MVAGEAPSTVALHVFHKTVVMKQTRFAMFLPLFVHFFCLPVEVWVTQASEVLTRVFLNFVVEVLGPWNSLEEVSQIIRVKVSAFQNWAEDLRQSRDDSVRIQ